MIPFYAKDVGVVLEFSLIKADRSPFDLNGFTARLYSATVPTAPLALDIPNPSSGVAEYTIAAKDTFPAGRHQVQIRIQDGAGLTFRTPEFEIVSLKSPLTPDN